MFFFCFFAKLQFLLYLCTLIHNKELMDSLLQQMLLINIPAYICAGLALYRKFNQGQYYEAVVFTILMLDLFGLAYFTAMVLNPMTATGDNMQWLAIFTVLIIPILYLFHAPYTGHAKLDWAAVVLFLIGGLIFVPATSIELAPSYAMHYSTMPMAGYGVSIFYRGLYLFHVDWIIIILMSQTVLALMRVWRVVQYVRAQGGRYSFFTQAVLAWDFNCGYFLAVFFIIPLSLWQTPVMRLVYMIIAACIIGVGSLLIFFGFDLNPISEDSGKRSSLKQFVKENSDLVLNLKYMLEEEKIYLEPGIQTETLVHRLGTNFIYFGKIMYAEYGISFPEYVHRARVRYAQQLASDYASKPTASAIPLTLDDIAAQCGYKETETFIRLYRHITSEDPAELLR